MSEVDPRIRRVRRIGMGVFIALSMAAIPIGFHLVQTRPSPELWLTLLGAVLMFVLISLFALETALSPIPPPMYATEDEGEAEGPNAEPETPGEEQSPADPAPSPEVIIPPMAPAEDPGAERDVLLAEVEEFPTMPPFQHHHLDPASTVTASNEDLNEELTATETNEVD